MLSKLFFLAKTRWDIYAYLPAVQLLCGAFENNYSIVRLNSTQLCAVTSWTCSLSHTSMPHTHSTHTVVPEQGLASVGGLRSWPRTGGRWQTNVNTWQKKGFHTELTQPPANKRWIVLLEKLPTSICCVYRSYPLTIAATCFPDLLNFPNCVTEVISLWGIGCNFESSDKFKPLTAIWPYGTQPNVCLGSSLMVIRVPCFSL